MEYNKVKSLYLEQAETIQKLFENKEFVELLFANDLLRSNFVDQISVLKFLEKKLSDTKLIQEEISKAKKKKKKPDLIEIKDLDKSDIYLKKFKEVTSSSPEFTSFDDLKNTEDIRDTIKYLNVFLKNTFNKDLKYFLENKPNETVQAERVKEEPKTNNFSENTSKENVNAGFGFGPMGGPGFGPGGMPGGMFGSDPTSYEAWKEQQITNAALLELRRQISTGQFYLFKSKPKIMLILKNILGSLLMIAGVIGILILISQIICTSSQANFLGLLWYGSSSGNPSPINLNFSQTFFMYIVYVAMIICFLFVGYKFIVNKKNENIVYGFDKRTAIIIIVILVFQSFISIMNLVNWVPHLSDVNGFTTGVYTDGTNSIAVKNTDSGLIAFNICLWSFVAELIIFFTIIVTFIICWVYAPKEDLERIDLKTREIIKEFKESNHFKNPN